MEKFEATTEREQLIYEDLCHIHRFVLEASAKNTDEIVKSWLEAIKVELKEIFEIL